MERINKLAVIPAILIALLGTASFTIVLANWDKIFTSNSSSNIDSKKLESLEKQLEELERLDNPTAIETIEPKVKAVEPITTSTATDIAIDTDTAAEEPKIIKTVVKDGIKFDFLGCEKQGRIICYFNVTAIDRDSNLSVYVHSGRAVVDGMQYKGTSGSLGGKSSRFIVDMNLIQGVPMKSYFTYPEITSATKMDFIEFRFSNSSLSRRSGSLKIVIKDISL
ncbi:MAG: hypothetical protein ACFBSE_12910 [Prochloraceae cyanobacterium]